jgi:elongator complex protein 3
MQKLSEVFSQACKEICDKLSEINNPKKEQIKNEIKEICARYSLERLPKNSEILSSATEEQFVNLQKILLKKPVKTASGVAVIAIMPKPFACPHGRCTFCPGGVEVNTPNSYTGKEPVTLSAIEDEYEPGIQIKKRIEQLIAFGHDPTKLELVIVGGTFLFMPDEYQREFIKSCYDAINGFESSSLEDAKKNNEKAKMRNVGFTIETKPDYCQQKHVDMMLDYGTTRVEIGVQSLTERVYNIVNRGHNLQQVISSFQIARDAGYKIVAHMMPGLPTMSPKEDIADFKKLFEMEEFKPDMLKIYPALVLKDTPLYDDYKLGNYKPYSTEDMIDVLSEAKKIIPKWIRVMRVQREITMDEIVDGPKMGNLRQKVHQELQKQGTSCKCIRCREAGLNNKKDFSELKLERINYNASGGKEVFLSFNDYDDLTYGFLRLRKPSNDAHREEITEKTSIVRELHVFGKAIKMGEQEEFSFQHQGIGKKLMNEAEKIASLELSSDKLCVISAVGTREYYKKLGYKIDGPYMAKDLR